MSRFECPVVKIEKVRSIPGASKIETAMALAFEVIVAKGQFRAGDRAIYVPVGAVLPEQLADSLKGTAKLFGSKRTRVRAFKLRGVLSDGLLLGPVWGAEGEDAAHLLGITKYEPIFPTHMRGRCIRIPAHTIDFDIENYKRHPRVLLGGEDVEITEKIHGTFCAVSVIHGLAHSKLPCGDTLIYSKGLGKCGFVFQSGEDNLYTRTAERYELRRRLVELFGNRAATVFGEIYGMGVQDLDYGVDEPRFTAFDLYIGTPGSGRFVDRDEFEWLAEAFGSRAPILYRGAFDRDALSAIATGTSCLGTGIREGVVVVPHKERLHPKIGRVALKYISPEYLLRSRPTERA